MQLAYIMGRTPRLALRELEATARILPFRWSMHSVQANIVRLKPELEEQADGSSYLSLKDSNNKAAITGLQRRLGGTVRTVYLHKLVERAEIVPALLNMIEGAQSGKEGKLTLGVSVWGKGLQPFHLAKQLKSKLQEDGRSVRFVTPRDGMELSTAQVLHNRLAYFPEEGNRMELALIAENGTWWVGCTLAVQDIEAYTKRDFSIPAPDPVSGMLSPKLAQSMVNIAVAGDAEAAVYDPFCGNGRIVLEGWYMGVPAYGSDIEPRKVAAARKNLAWLSAEYGLNVPDPETLIWEADATEPSARAELAKRVKGPWHVVGEPYLGKPLRAKLKPEAKKEWLDDLQPLYEAFFQVWANVPANERPQSFLLVVPRARVSDGSEAALYDRIVDRLDRLGYSSKVLFCYDRPDSYIRRDLVQVSYR